MVPATLTSNPPDHRTRADWCGLALQNVIRVMQQVPRARNLHSLLRLIAVADGECWLLLGVEDFFGFAFIRMRRHSCAIPLPYFLVVDRLLLVFEVRRREVLVLVFLCLFDDGEDPCLKHRPEESLI